jgi:hypothetical protein
MDTLASRQLQTARTAYLTNQGICCLLHAIRNHGDTDADATNHLLVLGLVGESKTLGDLNVCVCGGGGAWMGCGEGMGMDVG